MSYARLHAKNKEGDGMKILSCQPHLLLQVSLFVCVRACVCRERERARTCVSKDICADKAGGKVRVHVRTRI